jgi:succinate dehydrogenase / fumarate reductase cytochrome b subunit
MNSWVFKALRSTIGQKWLMGLSGLFMIFFLLGHLSGNLLVFAGPEAINTYAETLRKFPALLWGFRILSIVALVVHVVTAISLTKRNRAANPIPYASSDWKGSSWSSRNMGMTGFVILLYMIYHLAHFTWRLTHPELFSELEAYDVYQMVVLSFQDPGLVALYVVATFTLCLHLTHSISSSLQTLGINHPKYNPVIKSLGEGLAILLFLGFSSIPVAVLLGILS